MEKTKKELEKEFMKFPELEEKQEIIKRMNNINTFQAYKNEICLRGTDEYGNDFTVWWDSYDFMTWIYSDSLKYIGEQLTKYIQEK